MSLRIKLIAIWRLTKARHFLMMFDQGWVGSVPKSSEQNELMVKLAKRLDEIQSRQDKPTHE